MSPRRIFSEIDILAYAKVDIYIYMYIFIYTYICIPGVVPYTADRQSRAITIV